MAIIGTLPYTISDGQVIDAVPVQTNFNWILSQVNANAIGVAPGTTGNVLVSNGTIWTSVSLTSQLTNYAPLASPVFTGNPTAPNSSLGTSNNQIATTAFATLIGIGTAQTGWTVQSTRVAGTNYNNYANGPLCVTAQVLFSAAGDTAQWSVNGVEITKMTGYGASTGAMMVIVPYQNTYQLVLTGGATLVSNTWREF